MHVGQEVWDEVRVVDARSGNTADGRVSQLIRLYMAGRYVMQIIMGGDIYAVGIVPMPESVVPEGELTPEIYGPLEGPIPPGVIPLDAPTPAQPTPIPRATPRGVPMEVDIGGAMPRRHQPQLPALPVPPPFSGPTEAPSPSPGVVPIPTARPRRRRRPRVE